MKYERDRLVEKKLLACCVAIGAVLAVGLTVAALFDLPPRSGESLGKLLGAVGGGLAIAAWRWPDAWLRPFSRLWRLFHQ